MKTLGQSPIFRYVALVLILHLSACAREPLRVTFPPTPTLPDLKLKPLPLNAALVLPDSLVHSVYEQSLACWFHIAQRKAFVPIGKEIEQVAMPMFQQAFEQVQLVSDRSDALGRYDVVIELESPTLRLNDRRDCERQTIELFVGIPLGIGLIMPFETLEMQDSSVSVSGKVFDSQAQGNLADAAYTANANNVSGALLASLDQVIQRIARAPKLTQYAQSLPHTARQRALARAQQAPSELVSPQTPARDDEPVNIEEVPRFRSALRENDVAVVIGVESYQALPKADFAAKDAKLMKDYLLAMGYREGNIELLVNERATFGNFKRTFQAWLPNRVKPGSRVFVYYSGHGAPDPTSGESYLVPTDGDASSLADTGFPLRRLYENLGKLPAQEVVVMLDSCFSGAGGRSVLAPGTRPLVTVKPSAPLPPNVAVFSAAQETQISTAYPAKQHGLFTYYVLKAMKDGRTMLADIYQTVRPVVEDRAKRQNVQQTPSLVPEPQQLQGRFQLVAQ